LVQFAFSTAIGEVAGNLYVFLDYFGYISVHRVLFDCLVFRIFNPKVVELGELVGKISERV